MRTRGHFSRIFEAKQLGCKLDEGMINSGLMVFVEVQRPFNTQKVALND